jgi:hypothetical protein
MQDVTDVADVDVGSMFVFMEKKFDMYAEYVNGLPRAALALRRLRAAPSPTIAVAGGAPLPQPIAVPAYFLQHPLRRVLQYGLFLRSLVAKYVVPSRPLSFHRLIASLVVADNWRERSEPSTPNWRWCASRRSSPPRAPASLRLPNRSVRLLTLPVPVLFIY